MQPQQITDDLDKLLEVLPPAIQEALAAADKKESLLEVLLDLGRLPEARYPDRAITLGNKYISRIN